MVASVASPVFLGIDDTSTSLDRLSVGARARIESVSGDRSVRRRLLEMGLCQGVEVEMLRRAPFGGPVELRVRGYLLSLRADQARLVKVAPKR